MTGSLGMHQAIAALLLAGCAASGAPNRVVRKGLHPTEQAIRTAVDANARLYSYVLWNDRVPSWARASTVGAALRALAQDAAARRHAGVRVELLSPTLDLTAVEVNPSQTDATVHVTEDASRITYRSGRPLGAAVRAAWRVVVEVRRPSRSSGFRVTAVTPDREERPIRMLTQRTSLDGGCTCKST